MSDDETQVLDFTGDGAVPRVDIFERMRVDPEYAMTVVEHIKRTHPERLLEWVEDSIKVDVSGTLDDLEVEVEWQ